MAQLVALRGPAGNSGQTTVEYILLLSIVVLMVGIVIRSLSDRGLGSALMRPLAGDYARIYRYGDAQTRGFDEDGGPTRHPRIHGSGGGGGSNEGVVSGNFRMFINQP